MKSSRARFTVCAAIAFATPGSATAVTREAAMGAGAPDERIGVMTHFAQGWDLSWIPAVAPAIEVRDELYWDSVEPTPGVFVWPGQFDSMMSALKGWEISPLIVLDFENHNYDGGMTPYTDAGVSAFARYGVETLRHYGSQIQAVEIWNEYNGSFCKGPATEDRSSAYLKMLKVAYARLKEERPDLTVVGGATSGVPLPYWQKLIDGGAMDFMDALSVHPYRYTLPPEGIESDIASLKEMMRRHGGIEKPIWVTEIGWYTKPSVAPGDVEIDDTTQAKFLVRAYALLLSAGVQRVYWYLLHDDQGLDMGLYQNDPAHTPKPAERALATMLSRIGGADFVKKEASASGLYSLLFSRGRGNDTRVIWALKPTTVTLSNVSRVTDLMGRDIPLTRPLALRLTDAPVFVDGQIAGLPPPTPKPGTVIANSRRGFASVQGKNGWTYGTYDSQGQFEPLPQFQVSDWTASWTGPEPYISVTPTDQHPSTENGVQVAAVRRWTSGFVGTVEMTGEFMCESTQGDGVGAGIAVDGQRLSRAVLGGGNAIVTRFDFSRPVQPGTTIDFWVDPGPGSDINFDATAVSVTVRKLSP